MIRRLLAGLVTLVAASILVFVATTVLPGSPAGAVLGKGATPAAVAKLDRQLGFDRPAVDRYFHWVGDVLHGDLGDSAVAIAEGAPSVSVWSAIKGPLANSATLALTATLLLIPISLVLGVLAGRFAGRWPDHAISTSALIFMALPEFVVGALLIVIFFVVLNVLPPVSLLAPGASPLAHPEIMVLPVLTLLLVSLAWTVRLIRSGMIETLRADYVRMARLNGINEARVLRRYVLRNALAPSVQVFAMSIQYLFGGVIVTEAVFSYPGIGTQLVDAIVSHDNTEVQAIAMLFAAVYIGINILADFTVLLLVPKLRSRP